MDPWDRGLAVVDEVEGEFGLERSIHAFKVSASDSESCQERPSLTQIAISFGSRKKNLSD